MCGIAGIIDRRGNSIAQAQLKTMSDTIVHRGPDAEGFYVKGCVGMAHRRLSILDLSDNGNQPMFSHDRKYIIVFNGEIYNYRDLKNELMKEGGVFCNETDTEVILESYRYWGTECVALFNGMWSFVLYDTEKELLFFSRDRFGIKPFYIYEDEDVFVFASEIKCITSIRPELKKVDIVQMSRYLKCIQEDMDGHTFYEKIKNFPKSNNMVYDLKTGKKEYRKYWEINLKDFRKKWACKNPYKKIREILADAVRIRLNADVPVGASLSGGIDSSIIVGISGRQFGVRMNTYSSIYEDVSCNEESFIECVNKKMKTIPHYIYPDKSEHILEDLKEQIYYHDGPCQSASPYSGYCVYRGVGDEVTVMLDGQGADELFGGYIFFYVAKLRELLRKNTWRGRLAAIQTILEFYRIWPEQANMLPDGLLKKALGMKAYRKLIIDGNKKDAIKCMGEKSILKEDFQNIYVDDAVCNAEDIENELDKALYLEFMFKKLPRILHDVDRNSMARSLEVRLPFLDFRLVEFAFTLSDKDKIRNSWTKYILRKSCRRYLPREVYRRRNKMGFPAPFDRWMRDERFRDEIKDYINAFKQRNVIDEDVLERHYREHMEGRKDWSEELFRIMSLEIWLQQEIDTPASRWEFTSGYDYYGGKRMFHIHSLEECLALVHQEKDVIIYGAGKLAEELIKRLPADGKYKILGILVSDLSGNKKELFGIEVKEVGGNDFKKETLVIIAAGKKYKWDIRKNLASRSFYNIAIFSDEFECELNPVGNNFNIPRQYFDEIERCIARTIPRALLKALVVNICDHCNLNCRGCDHFSPIADRRFVATEEIGRDLARVREILNEDIGIISVMGGEPLLHPELETILQQARSIFPTTSIWLSTNGLLLLKQGESFWECCRKNNIELNVTKYPVDFAYDKAEEIAGKHGVKYMYYHGGLVEKTLGHYPLNLDGDCDPTESFIHCFHANNECNMLSSGRLYTCTIAPNIPIFNKKYGVKILLTEADGIDIYAVSGKKELMERLSRPMPVCRYCDVRHRTFGHKYGKSKGEITEWT